MGSTRTFLQTQDAALGDDFEATKYRADVKVWINEALHKIARRVRLLAPLQGTAALNTVAGQDTYTLPADDVRLISLREPSQARELVDVGVGEIDNWIATGRGRPQVYAIWNGKLLLRPAPDGVYALEERYQRDATTLAADGDFLPLDDAYEDLPVYYARARLFEREDDYQSAAYYDGRFNTELQELRADAGRENRGRTRQLPSMWAGSGGSPRFTRP